MGVTGLWKLIEQSGKPVPLDTLENKVLAVDISIWLHQVVKGFQDSNGATLPNAHLLGLFNRLCKLMYYRIKPVFVFDGGVPLLKRETIARRARNKSKYQNEADKLQQMLLEALAKEKVVQQALGPSASALLTEASPKKTIKKAEEEEDDMFKLPPPPEDTSQNTDDFTDLTESDSSFEDKHRTHYNQNLQSIDVKSSYFQSLPADIRHEILSDIKETRKQSSWGRLHELPAESNSFSTFQIKRLLKRRQVQVELEEAEKEMGGKGLSMAELENLLSEEGVVDPDIATARIASSENVRYLHVRDITKALKKEEEEQKIKQEDVNVKTEEIKIEPINQEDLDLQKAIQLSVGGDVDVKEENNLDTNAESLKLTVEQRKALGSTASSLARTYMMEYGGLNDEEISDLVKLDESASQSTSEFKYNDISILIGETSNSETKVMSNLEKMVETADDLSEKSVSSDADSDFVEVPDADPDIDAIPVRNSRMPLPSAFVMNEPPLSNGLDSTKGNEENGSARIEVIIDPNTLCSTDDDIFADIFENISAEEKVLPKEQTPSRDENIAKRESPKEEASPEPFVEIDSSDDEVLPAVEKEPISNIDEPSKSSEASKDKMQSILDSLSNEIASVTTLNLDNLLINSEPSKNAQSHSITDLVNDLSKLKETLVAIEKALQKPEDPVTPTKIPQPFFVKKTPPSSNKKSPAAAEASTSVESPSKASKSLQNAFDAVAVPSTSKSIVDERETLRQAADLLRDQKTTEELEEIADQLNQERRDLAAERNKKDRLGVSITEQMSMECMDLLRLFGVPYVIAPMEAEAQCAYLNAIELTDGTITDDSDIWLFGGKTVYKNFFDQNKLVMEFRSNNIESLFHLDRNKLIQLSFLVGSDYTQGIHGVGAVTALEVLSIFNATPEKEGETTEIVSILSSLRKFRDWWHNKNVTQRTLALRNKLKNITFNEDFPNPRVVEAYLYPTVDENRDKFSWGHFEVENIREYAKKTFGWTKMKTDEIIMPVMKRFNQKISQQSIQNYFKVTGITSRKDLKVSKRVRTALDKMTNPDGDSADDAPIVPEEKMPRKRPVKKLKEKVTEPADNDKKEPAKPRRKRKAETNTNEVDDDSCEPSTSAAPSVKKVIIPDSNPPIPQREQDKKIMEANRLKAIEILKKSKK